MTYIERADEFMKATGLYPFRVGGSVRDELLGRDPKDADYVVFDAPLAKLGGVLRHTADKLSYSDATVKPLKLRDGTAVGWRLAARGLRTLEIVLPRTEVSTGPGHGDFRIVTDTNLSYHDDAQRRDFTFNALYRDVMIGDVADPTGRGMYDLEHRLVTTTHHNSFRDDPLRTLRALRFVSTLGYDLSTTTHAEMCEHSKHVTGLSGNGYASGTVLSELSRLLMGDDCVKALRIARDTGVLETLLPELRPMIGFDQASRYHTFTTDEHTFAALKFAVAMKASLRVRMALLFHDSGKPATAWMDDRGRRHYYAHERNDFCAHEDVGAEIAWAALHRLNATRNLRQDVVKLVEHHMLEAKASVKDSTAGRLRVKFGDDLLRDLIIHRLCDLAGKGRPNLEYLTYFAELRTRCDEFQAAGVPSKPRDLAISGRDVMAMEVEGGGIGLVLAAVLDEVVCQPDELRMSREWQLDRAEVVARAM